MAVQSLSIVVPAKKCINRCEFCCAGMVEEPYKNQMDENLPFYDLYLRDYLQRLEYCRNKGIDTVMLTGNCEPQQNRHFLKDFGLMMQIMKNPFENIEMQTTGALLDDNYLRFLRNFVGVKTISLSISSFDDEQNCKYINAAAPIELEKLAASIKKYDFNLRLSINLTDAFNRFSGPEFFQGIRKRFQHDQITFRILYSSGLDTPQDRWITQHKAGPTVIAGIREYIKTYGEALEILPFGNTKYDVAGVSTVLDDDCMSKEVSKDQKYYILRPNCKLYSRWDTPSSLIF